MTSTEKKADGSDQNTGATKEVAKKKLEENVLRRFTGGVKETVGGIAENLGPANVGRHIAIEVAEKKGWVKLAYRQHKIKKSITHGEVDENGSPVDAELVILEIKGNVRHFTERQKVFGKLNDTLVALAETELVRDTGRGGKIVIAQAAVQAIVQEVTGWQENGSKLLRIIDGADDLSRDMRLTCARYHAEALLVADELNHKLGEVQATCAEAINFEAIKAIVTNPEDDRYSKNRENVENALWFIDQGLSGVDSVGGVLEKVPDPHSKAAATGIRITISTLMVLRAGFGKLAVSIAVSRDVKKYNKNEPVGAHLKEHDANPLLIAELLARKRVANVELVLKIVAQPIVRELGALCPVPMVVDLAWTAIHDTVIGCFEKYQGDRIKQAQRILDGEEARKSLTAKDLTMGNAAGALKKYGLKIGEDFLESMKETVQADLFTALNPIALAASSIIHALAQRIARLVVETLPANPAEPVDGAALEQHLTDILGVLRHFVEVQPRPNFQNGLACPSWTSDGRAVQAVLSEELRGQRNGMPCWLVRLADGAVGSLYAMDNMFAPEENLGLGSGDLPPLEDSRKVTMTYVDVRSKTGPDDEDGVQVTTYDARVGAVLGMLICREDGNGKTWTFGVDEGNPVARTAFVDWSQRFIHYSAGTRRVGYEEKATGTFVSGTWYKPLKDHFYYLFISDTGIAEWAQGADLAGNLPNTPVLKVMESLGYESGTDLFQLLPLFN